MEGNNETISIVVPILNGADTIARQIDALIADRGPTTEIVLVDNGSTDATPEILRGYEESHEFVRVVVEPRRGVNYARNAGIAASTAEKILLCDCDDAVQPGWVRGLSAALDEADLVGGALNRRFADGRPAGGLAYIPDDYSEFGWGLTSPWGSNCGLRREVWERLGGFDSRMKLGGDEVDFFLRAQMTGSALVWVPEALIDYTVPEDLARHVILRTRRNAMNLSRAYWFGRLRGWSRNTGLAADIVKASLLVPLLPFSAHWRGVFMWRTSRRWYRLKGVVRFLPGELGQRALHRSDHQPVSNRRSRPFRRDWHTIGSLPGDLDPNTAAALHQLVSAVSASAAIVAIGETDPQILETLSMASSGRGTLVPFDSAAAYAGPPIGLLLLAGGPSTDAIVAEFLAWSRHLEPGASVVFGAASSTAVRSAVLRVRLELPSLMLRFGDLAFFTTV
jgi:glycosyltransferase involved in cell wall biosynthesis